MKYYECEDREQWVNLDNIESIQIEPNGNDGTFRLTALRSLSEPLGYKLNTFKTLDEARKGLELLLSEEQVKPQCIHASDAKIFLAHAIEFLSSIETNDPEIRINLQLADRLITKALITLEANEFSDAP